MVTLASLGFADLPAFQTARFGRKTSGLSLTPRSWVARRWLAIVTVLDSQRTTHDPPDRQ